MAQKHQSHKGELLLQERRKTPKELIDAIPQFIDSNMPQQHADFFAGLSYLPLATLDQQGRPWVSILVTTSDDDPSVGIKVLGGNTTDVVAETNPYDPFARALQQDLASAEEARLFAGVGVDFSNRRRNKIAGTIGESIVENTGKVRLRLHSDQHLGNCPKYITERRLAHFQRAAELSYDSFDTITSALPAGAKALVDRASTVFLATRHIAESDASDTLTDMGVNHRGGAPSFTRIYEEVEGDQVTTYLVLPDHSGNRFYQSLGNIETNPQVGLVFPDFITGHVLYVTGEAENLFAEKAETLMPRVSLLTRIKVTGAVFVADGLNLKLTSEEQFSPYNPPVKLLRQELEQMGHSAMPYDDAAAISATLVSTQVLSDNIKTFTFKLSSPVNAPLPGGFGVFDFSGILDVGYSHMNEANPQLVNEDYIRTWTLSSAPRYDPKFNTFRGTDHVNVTVKRKPGGLASNVLHDNADKHIDRNLPVVFKGAGAGFSCFAEGHDGTPPSVPPKMLWIAGGVGITPFMSMWDGIQQVAKANPDQTSTDIVLMFTGRDDDIGVLNHFASRHGSLPDQVKLSIVAFQSVSSHPSAARSVRDGLRETLSDNLRNLEERRMKINDFRTVADLSEREVFMCGPAALMNWSEELLTELNVDESRRHRETFTF
ncbi:pyridoxamine 5'-phosphate oxidase family protein [Ruegeria atlantica]|uniref:Bifunctional nitric oxide dioxygenase/dihydropteridine reductase 2 n=2 Tax=Ruegeria atlantica TaxID=81569 RepID=A0A0P1ECZ9_9RHOB|nr:pyridoxamine 5'-phosphate oxidase family protein [Ruegeria atlantica]CUH41245.1 bifunctional nitric oxide dioxygenase/dihydropteridine reductase 2 [Ruegeria atlantica]CUH47593.1 bifunctional nitric oxide dioxygenase/dihydropteridine reductase 2 [Ruegeria atlantica]